MADATKQKNLRARRLLGYGIAAFIILGAAAMFIFRDAIGDALGATTSDASRGEAWIFETGYSQTFAAAGNGLAAASSTGLQLLGPDGYTVARELFPLDSPAVSASDKLAAAWDVGGTALYVTDMAGNVTDLSGDDSLISVTVSEGGMVAVCTEKTGYKGLVTVYDASLTPVYEWYSGEGYLITACVSPDGKMLATLCVESDGGHVHTFSLDSEAERGDYISAGELFVDLSWLSNSTLCALSETRAAFISKAGEAAGSYDYGGMYLSARSFGGDGFVTLALSTYLSGSADAVVTVDAGGGELGRLETEGELKALSANGKEILCLYTNSMGLYSQSMSRRGNLKEVSGVKWAGLRGNGDALAVLSASVRVYSF